MFEKFIRKALFGEPIDLNYNVEIHSNSSETKVVCSNKAICEIVYKAAENNFGMTQKMHESNVVYIPKELTLENSKSFCSEIARMAGYKNGVSKISFKN